MMRAKEKIERLRAEIEKQLIPLIDSDYVLWDLPYHTNIGDTLIWQGEWNGNSYFSYWKCRFVFFSERHRYSDRWHL